MCQARVSKKSVLQECFRVLRESVLPECATRVSSKSVRPECLTRVSHKSVPQEYLTRVYHKSVTQESHTTVREECPARVFCKSGFQCDRAFPVRFLLRELLKHVFGFVVSIRLLVPENSGYDSLT